ncbi:acetolactate synthase, small subunit [Thermobaculum terrenum ATCC BAA-798]|uniref:Acetolactate synthase small subunit n=1 Tax=Thermobaculum terrenum (strain ATCC BAA-798 / CCMEE 7001 / YNP1) TaxID=525904 RepID=D1CDV3_THET1|nr:acetolactate synthase small subunit [Thermobaculum terrenum]ACZ41109.1 acetolactate synthase, small subunit [Thermobaculum terrenum ATCC BAA-798]
MSTQGRTLVALVQDHPGVLTRISGLFRRRNFNIESLAVGHSEKPGVSRMTIVVNGDASEVDQVVKQLSKLIEVIEVKDISEGAPLLRELALIRVAVDGTKRTEVTELAKLFGAKVIDISHHSITLEMTGSESKVDSLVRLLEPFGITEMVRTGRVAMARDMADTSSAERSAISA